MGVSAPDRVLIAGGGIAGLAAAKALQRRGISSLILEQRQQPADAGLAINLPGNAIHAVAALGLSNELERLGQPIGRREYRSETGKLLFAVDEDAFWGAEGRPRCVRRADLLRLLARDLPLETMRRDQRVTMVRPSPDLVEVELSDGTVESGSLLVGADGVHSTVRDTIMDIGAVGGALLAPASWRFMAPNPGVDCWTLWAGSGALFLLIPVDNNEIYGWVASQRPGGSSDLREMGAILAKFPKMVRDMVETVLGLPGSVYHSPLQDVRMSRWSRGRVLLVGDAAHAMAPVWAQGAALALEDALVLAEVASRSDWDQVGQDYDSRRRARIAHVQTMTDRLSRAAQLPGWLRNRLIPLMGPRSYRATFEPLRRPVID
jgi:2-polyprenyl-6-methoxyphenol hydroxylase-like FAD-dependent oxidoreductase